MSRRKDRTAATRMKRYRARNQGNPEEIARRVATLRAQVRSDCPDDLLEDYVRVSDALTAELERPGRRAKAVQELVASKSRLAESLGLTPKERRLAGDAEDDLVSAAIAKSVENVRAVQARAWTDLQEEIRLFGRKEDLGGQTRADFVREIADLRLARPHLFSPEELALPAADLFDRVLAGGPPGPAPVM